MRQSLIPILIAFACASCGEDPKLVEKHEKQKAEVARLKGELALVEEKLKNMPADVSEDLEKAKKQAGEQAAEAAGVGKENPPPEARKRTPPAGGDANRPQKQGKKPPPPHPPPEGTPP